MCKLFVGETGQLVWIILQIFLLGRANTDFTPAGFGHTEQELVTKQSRDSVCYDHDPDPKLHQMPGWLLQSAPCPGIACQSPAWLTQLQDLPGKHTRKIRWTHCPSVNTNTCPRSTTAVQTKLVCRRVWLRALCFWGWTCSAEGLSATVLLSHLRLGDRVVVLQGTATSPRKGEHTHLHALKNLALGP